MLRFVCAVESFGAIVTIGVDDFDGLNTAVSANDLAITKSENGLELKFGAGTLVSGVTLMEQVLLLLDKVALGLTAVMQNLEILVISNSLISGLQTIPVMTRN